MTHWEQPLISVDVVAVSNDSGVLRHASHRRRLEPYADRAALPGVLLLAGESLEGAARRAVADKLRITEPQAIRHLSQFNAFDGTNRDPRGATISIAHLAVIEGLQGSAANWHDLRDHPAYPFDHDTIVTAAMAQLAQRFWTDLDCTRALLGQVFTTSETIALAKQLGARLPAPETNLSRWLKACGLVTKVGLRGRDTVWEWS